MCLLHCGGSTIVLACDCSIHRKVHEEEHDETSDIRPGALRSPITAGAVVVEPLVAEAVPVAVSGAETPALDAY